MLAENLRIQAQTQSVAGGSALWNQLKLTRELYNAGLEELIVHYKTTGKHLNLFAQDKNHGTKEHPEIAAVLVDTTLKRLHQSFSNFFGRCKEGAIKKGFPRFKAPNRWHSLQFRDAKTNGIRDTCFCAPRAMGGRMRFNRHRDIQGIIKFCRVLRKPSGWILQVVCERQPELLPKTEQEYWVGFWYQRFGLGTVRAAKLEIPLI